MADTFTTYYNLTKPQIGGDPDTWGQLLNDNFDTIDTQLHNANTYALPLAGGTVTGDTTFQGAVTFTTRPKFGTATPWDSANRSNPVNCSTSDGITLDWGSHTSGQIGVTVDTSYQGYLWHSGNFTPGNYAPLSGAAFSGSIKTTGAASGAHLTSQGGTVSWNDNSGSGQMCFTCNKGQGAGGFTFATVNAGNTSRVTELSSDGSGHWSAPDFSSTSDEQLKAAIKPLRRGLDELKRMPPREFVKFPDKNHMGTGREEVGFLAQEVREVLPEAVWENSDGYLAVSPGQILALLARAILELDGRMALAGI